MNQKFGSLNQKVHMNKLQTLCWEDIKLNYYIDEQFGVGFD